ncbi:MAG TPA: VWA domain-containing protein [Urbifossiella sp.]|nr:VWA domain-containing protein [Urbifossiella sp.]
MHIRYWLGLTVLTATAALASGQPPAEFARARPAIEKQLRDKAPGARVAGLEALRQYPTAAAAALALAATQDADDYVRAAAFRTLVQLHADEGVRTWMTTSVERDAPTNNATLAVVLLSAEADDAKLTELLAKRYKGRPARVAELVTGVIELGSWPDPGAVRALRRVAQLPFFPASQALKWGVVESLFALGRPDTVPVLIDLLDKTDGEVQYQVGAHLERVTGATFATSTGDWRNWWEQNKNTFRYPTPDALARAAARPKEEPNSYYGIPIRTRRVVFVVDCSGSMIGDRLASAKAELTKVIERLPAKTEFNIVAYSTTVVPWSPTPVVLTDATRKSAVATVAGLRAAGGTSTYDALSAALNMNADTIFLLTDGEPSSGTIVQTDAIVAAIRARNRAVGCSIHTIGIGLGARDEFLRALARQNHGQYRAVE